MPALPWLAAIAETIISGAEVPKPTITMPISSGGIPRRLALAAAPLTKRSAPQTSTIRPPAIAATASNMAPPLGRYRQSPHHADRRRQAAAACSPDDAGTGPKQEL